MRSPCFEQDVETLVNLIEFHPLPPQASKVLNRVISELRQKPMDISNRIRKTMLSYGKSESNYQAAEWKPWQGIL